MEVTKMKKTISAIVLMSVLVLSMMSMAFAHPSKDVVEPEKLRVGHTKDYWDCKVKLAFSKVRSDIKAKHAVCDALDYK